MPQSRMNKRSSSARSPRLPVVAHKSTGGMLNSIPQPVDPVGNASERLTNNTVALPLFQVKEQGKGFLALGFAEPASALEVGPEEVVA